MQATRIRTGSAARKEPRGNVLLVDDEPLVSRAIGRLLASVGFTVRCAESAAEALGAIEVTPPDVVLTDLNMPGMSGVELLRHVHALDADLPVVLLSAAPTLHSAIEAVEQGALGYLVKPAPLDELTETLQRATVLRRLWRAQREAQGRGGLQARTPQEWTALESAVTTALGVLSLRFQPIVGVRADGTFGAVGYEALMRGLAPGIPDPPGLVAAARAVGRSHALGRRVRALAAAGLADAPADVSLYVNMTASDLLDPELYDPAAPLSQVASRVVLELTEGVSFGDVPEIVERIADLRRLGYRLALDDLGSGYAALESLVQLRPDVAKICMTLVRDLHRDPMRAQLVGTVLDFCRRLSLPVICEGVETREELAALRDLGAELFQGYLFGRPAEAFAAPATI